MWENSTIVCGLVVITLVIERMQFSEKISYVIVQTSYKIFQCLIYFKLYSQTTLETIMPFLN